MDYLAEAASASNFAINPSNSFGNGATSLIGTPVNGCANAMLYACRNMRFNHCFINSLFLAKSPYLSSPAIGKPK